mgnify:CR=1 FL=1
MVFVFALNTNANSTTKIEDPCFDAAIDSYEQAVEKYGEFSDENGVDYLNAAYAQCDVWMKMN